MIKKFVVAFGFVLACVTVSSAADVSLRPPPPVSYQTNWTDFYVGGFLGGAATNTNYCAFAAAGFACADFKSSGWGGGAYMGFEYEFRNRIVAGARATVPLFSLTNSAPAASAFVAPAGGLAPGSTITGNEKYAILLDGTIGYDMGAWLPYIGAGLAFASVHAEQNQPGVGIDTATEQQAGLDLLAGVRIALSRHWALGFQYNYVSFARTDYQFVGPVSPFGGGTGSIPIEIAVNSGMAMVDYRF